MAMLAITNLSKVPLRLVTFSGFAGAVLSVLVSLAYLIYKLIFWSRFSVGVAPLVIGVFFFMSIQMLFMGIVGEYIGTIHTLVQKRPLVVEQERINFEYGPGKPLSEDEADSGGPGDDGNQRVGYCWSGLGYTYVVQASLSAVVYSQEIVPRGTI